MAYTPLTPLINSILTSSGQFQGLDWNEVTDTYNRTGTIAFASSGSAGTSNLPIQSLMKRCLLLDNGTVNYYLRADDSTLKADGTAAVLDGTDGQVMVQIPKFYYKYEYALDVHSWKISIHPLNGYTVHPAFVKNGVEVPYRYIGAYEGYVSTGKLSSVSGVTPTTSLTRAVYRADASARGTGWRQQDFNLISAIQLLFVVEYATFNSQTAIGSGISNVTDWATYNYYNPITNTGNSNVFGNASNPHSGTFLNGSTTCADVIANAECMSYRGIENFYGHIWKFVDGFNINDNIPYVCNNNTHFADDATTNYTRLQDYAGSNITLVATSGYQKTLTRTGIAFLPSSVGGSSSTYVPDYYSQDAGWRVAILGGAAYNGAYAGAFSWYLSDGSGFASRAVGGRLAF